MNTEFSLHRIKLLLLTDKKQFKQYLLSTGAYIAVYIIYLIIFSFKIGQEVFTDRDFSLYRTGLIIYFIFFCILANQKVHQTKGLYLTLPASAAEKYITLLLEGFLLLLLFHISFSIVQYAISLFIPGFPAPGMFGMLKYIKIPASIFLFIASTVFLSFITFRKYAAPIIIGIYALIFTASVFLLINPASREDGHMDKPTLLSNSLDFLIQHYGIILYTATLVVLYIGYLTLKRKQIR